MLFTRLVSHQPESALLNLKTLNDDPGRSNVEGKDHPEITGIGCLIDHFKER